MLDSRPRGGRFEPRRRHIYPSLVLVHPRKNRFCLTERLLKGRKASNQTNKLANSTDPNDKAVFDDFHLGLHCLPKYLFTSIQNEKVKLVVIEISLRYKGFALTNIFNTIACRAQWLSW